MYKIEKRRRGNWALYVTDCPEYATLELMRTGWAVIIRTNDYWANPVDRAYGLRTRPIALQHAKDWLALRHRTKE